MIKSRSGSEKRSNNVHVLKSLFPQSLCNLRVEIQFDGDPAAPGIPKQDSGNYFATYNTFYIKGEEDNYRLSLADYEGTAGDRELWVLVLYEGMSYNNGHQFSTRDRDNDGDASRNCAQLYSSGWWFDACTKSNLNGVWGVRGGEQVRWDPLNGVDITLLPSGVIESTVMKVRVK